VLGVRGAGFWRPLAAVLAGILVPAACAFVALSFAGSPGLDDGPWLRQQLLLLLYALLAAPLAAVLVLPVLWALALALAARGRAGLCSGLAAAPVLGLGAVHVLLHGDLTVESPAALPALCLALALQGWTVWSVFWVLQGRSGRPDAAFEGAGPAR
jgi:hypothetical protein